MAEVIDVISRLSSGATTAPGQSARTLERQDVSVADPSTVRVGNSRDPSTSASLAACGVDPQDGLSIRERKPSWLRVEAKMGEDYLGLRKTMRSLKLVTVCEEAELSEHL